MYVASAEPLTFAVAAPGFKPVAVPAKFGFYRMTVKLPPAAVQGNAEVTWVSITEQEFMSSVQCP
jgi:hypothetical protein